MMIELLNIDCMEYMATCEDKAFDLAIVDPPYGKNIASKSNTGKSGGTDNRWVTEKADFYIPKKWDNKKPDKKYFDELFRVSTNQIIWGANYFQLPTSSGWIFWDKKSSGNYSDGELAFSSFEKPLAKFEWLWNGFRKEQPEIRIHPTQKPVALYKWLLKNYAEPGQRILDTHLGSGSSAIAAHYFGCDFVGCEIDKEYYDAMMKRFKRETAQLAMFEGI